ncbi:OmpA family protein [Vibrio fluvialis]|nr:OmpA family protein [Vibrio fluvialis]MBY7850350.1 OmpA family protein [Vibrio fluvialis]MBY8287145.1 OmpA family protein [Vibrio fluvialis]
MFRSVFCFLFFMSFYVESNTYVGGYVGRNASSFEDCVDCGNSGYLQGVIGEEFLGYLSAELGFHHFRNTSVEYLSDLVSLSGRMSIPLNDYMDLYAKLGIYEHDVNFSKGGSIGLVFNVDSNVRLHLDNQYIFRGDAVDGHKINMMSLGVNYYFPLENQVVTSDILNSRPAGMVIDSSKVEPMIDDSPIESHIPKDMCAENIENILSGQYVFHFGFDIHYEALDDVFVYSKVIDCISKESRIKVLLVGHADNQGSNQYNYVLSLKRAVTISNILVELGVDPEQIVIEAKGDSEPIANNAILEQRKKNRRVEMILSI